MKYNRLGAAMSMTEQKPETEHTTNNKLSNAELLYSTLTFLFVWQQIVYLIMMTSLGVCHKTCQTASVAVVVCRGCVSCYKPPHKPRLSKLCHVAPPFIILYRGASWTLVRLECSTCVLWLLVCVKVCVYIKTCVSC